MQALAQRLPGKFMPTTIVTNYNQPQHDISRSRIPEGMTTVLSMLEIKEFDFKHVIFNILVDMHDVERKVLCEVSPSIHKCQTKLSSLQTQDHERHKIYRFNRNLYSYIVWACGCINLLHKWCSMKILKRQLTGLWKANFTSFRFHLRMRLKNLSYVEDVD